MVFEIKLLKESSAAKVQNFLAFDLSLKLAHILESDMKEIRMVDLLGQYERIKPEIDAAIQGVLDTTAFINGPEVKKFSNHLSQYLDVQKVVPCANGTDALQIALMALDIDKGAEIILPSFNYVATAEVIALLGFKPVFVDVDYNTFNAAAHEIEQKITPATKAIMAVHLFGQCVELDKIGKLAQKHNLFLIEDNAQSLGAEYIFPDGKKQMAGTVGIIGTTSFFPSKNLGCMGDGGAIFTNDEKFAEKLSMIVNHGQKKKYTYEIVGVNSRLDTLQAAILDVKLKYLNSFIEARQKAARFYNESFKNYKMIKTPETSPFSTHVFHQYTLKISNGKRDELQKKLAEKNIPTMVYYPSPLHLQNAYKSYGYKEQDFPISEQLCREVISLPMHTELDEEQLKYIVQSVVETVDK